MSTWHHGECFCAQTRERTAVRDPVRSKAQVWSCRSSDTTEEEKSRRGQDATTMTLASWMFRHPMLSIKRFIFLIHSSSGSTIVDGCGPLACGLSLSEVCRRRPQGYARRGFDGSAARTMSWARTGNKKQRVRCSADEALNDGRGMRWTRQSCRA